MNTEKNKKKSQNHKISSLAKKVSAIAMVGVLSLGSLFAKAEGKVRSSSVYEKGKKNTATVVFRSGEQFASISAMLQTTSSGKDNLSFFINEPRKHSGVGYTIDKTADREGASVSDKGEKSFDILVLNQESDRNWPKGLEKDKQYILILYENDGKEGELLMPSVDFKRIISMDLAVFKEKSRRNKTFLLNAMEAVAQVCKEPDLQEIVREMKKVNETCRETFSYAKNAKERSLD